MPEIAEVRLIADNIEGFLKGNQITKIDLLHPDILVKYANRNLKGLKEFNTAISTTPVTVLEVGTKGKFCWISLENGWNIMISFGMSGNVRVEPTPKYLQTYNTNLIKRGAKPVDKETFLKHCHLKINYKNPGTEELNHFYYHDIRRFGSWTFVSDPAPLNKQLNKLGHDPLSESELPDNQVIALFRRFNYHNICKALMSQELIAGIGNYLKAEMLYEALVNPNALIKDIPNSNILILYKTIRTLAKNAYQSGGASLYTYTGMNGDQTEFKNTLKVYKQDKDPLGNPVQRIPEKQSPDRRSTFWVPAIQTVGIQPKKKIIIKKLV